MRQYCVTGVSKLSDQREILTPPCSRQNALHILNREKAKPLRDRDYTLLRMEDYNQPVQLPIRFTNP